MQKDRAQRHEDIFTSPFETQRTLTGLSLEFIYIVGILFKQIIDFT